MFASTSVQAASIEDSCQSAKNKSSGKLAACLQNAAAKFAISGDNAAYSEGVGSCTAKFTSAYNGAETKATDKGGACPSSGDEADLRAAIQDHSDCVAGVLSGGDPTCLTCGNGVLDAGEDCDLGEPGTGDCDSATAGATPIGELSCSPSCQHDTSDCKACPGGMVLGTTCWYLGTYSASCTATCTAAGLTYDAATADEAGGSTTTCSTVMTALGSPGGPASGISGASGGLGCFALYGMRYVDLGTVTAGGSLPDAQRACACQ